MKRHFFRTMLEMFPLKAELLEEEDGSVTLALDQLDMSWEDCQKYLQSLGYRIELTIIKAASNQ